MASVFGAVVPPRDIEGRDLHDHRHPGQHRARRPAVHQSGDITNASVEHTLLADLDIAKAARQTSTCLAASAYRVFIADVQVLKGTFVSTTAARILTDNANYLIAACPRCAIALVASRRAQPHGQLRRVRQRLALRRRQLVPLLTRPTGTAGFLSCHGDSRDGAERLSGRRAFWPARAVASA